MNGIQVMAVERVSKSLYQKVHMNVRYSLQEHGHFYIV